MKILQNEWKSIRYIHTYYDFMILKTPPTPLRCVCIKTEEESERIITDPFSVTVRRAVGCECEDNKVKSGTLCSNYHGTSDQLPGNEGPGGTQTSVSASHSHSCLYLKGIQYSG